MDTMRRFLIATLSLAWAACFVTQAVVIPHHPSLGIEAAGAVVAGIAALANIVVAALFLWLLTWTISDRPRDTTPLSDWLRPTFGAAAAVSMLGALFAITSGEATLLGAKFLQLAALLASYLVIEKEWNSSREHHADNDNIPLGARLMAWSAARNALADRTPHRMTASRGKGH